ncbi:glycoside hydrolase [Pseudalgibacter alginicilyticus]|uniref:Glycoside hydrolase n=1 Tax=Pseudalgibacter alginicilyticus TaxID=1736674 RepID=A0A0P0CX17_9FLAO|nr:glycoside hydrolase TIM-barrel-like domain-containing protein [Pseudalgibacter alginicilyticus]ALJ05071.1 glycoside hydrolase [Pseudalgibacter alginicilyticus]
MNRFKILIGVILLINQSCTTQTQKINGVSFVASRELISDKHTKPVVAINANYAAIMPFGFIRNLTDPEITFNTERQWIGERVFGAKQYIEELQEQSIKIMLKPQIWVRGGYFTGEINMQTEADWQTLEVSYSKFVLEYAKLAETKKVDVFCIGTELEKFVAHRPAYWNELIISIKKIYKGKLTYAANWNEYEKTTFWNQMDYIGIDAYFPVSDSKTPTIKECLEGWEMYKSNIHKFSIQYHKPILFTEFGYRSVDYSGKAPWKSDRDMGNINLEAQNNATHALFEAFWNEDWFAGGFVWKWHHNHEVAGGENNDRFTPQNKPVELLIKEHYNVFSK